MEEPAFFQALLTAVLYVHLPLSDDSGKVRLICFTRPDGITVIPVFSDDVKAHAAARGAARVVAVVGRELFESAPGATWMLDRSLWRCADDCGRRREPALPKPRRAWLWGVCFRAAGCLGACCACPEGSPPAYRRRDAAG
ncbi:SseB family protein [Vulcaniibacterium tengchongense]|uniref:SseB family protein n=1 Tax=Vulcaniibacterium tengchongense TaxID=1273429 RepID=UPI003CE45366